MLIDLFIAAGWHTVPLDGELKRLPDGSKTNPKFEYNWRKKYTETFNEKQSSIAGAITGSVSGFMAIDCDNTATFELFTSLDHANKFIFLSKGKPAGGGTLIYRNVAGLNGFKLATEQFKLDFYNEEGFVYLPTEDNFTKESWADYTSLPELREAPTAVVALLDALANRAKPEAERYVNTVVSNRLAPLLETFVKKKEYNPALFKVLTPKSFRDTPSYVSKGHMHPNEVPQGRGSEYLSKISAILGADISVNVELYTNTMMLINKLWSAPMPQDKLLATIINPMVEGRSSIGGHAIWQYDQHWEQMGFIATALNGDYMESFYDDIKGLYYLINYTVPYIKVYSDKRPLLTTVKTLLGRQINEFQYDSTKQIIRTDINPSMEFGHIEGCDRFNLFRQTPELAVLNTPKAYASRYNRPNTIISFFESFIPDDFMRAYTLSFMKTKLTTFKYSPVVLYLIGRPGSGKDTFVGLFKAILGSDYVAKPDSKVFLEQYNGWLMDKFVVQLDEYGNKLTRHAEKQEVLGKLKSYTGADQLQIRAMHKDGFNYKHSLLFILTANTNPLPIETEDRRVAFIRTPNRLEREDWVIAEGGVSIVQAKMKEEVLDFCYYLATEVKSLHPDEYMIAPETEDKMNLIFGSLSAGDQICTLLQTGNFIKLAELAIEYGIVKFTDNWDKDKLMDEKLLELYELMTEGAGSHRALIRMLKDIGISRMHTTIRGENVFFYQIHGLSKGIVDEGDVEARDFFEKTRPIGI